MNNFCLISYFFWTATYELIFLHFFSLCAVCVPVCALWTTLVGKYAMEWEGLIILFEIIWQMLNINMFYVKTSFM